MINGKKDNVFEITQIYIFTIIMLLFVIVYVF